MQIDFSKLKLIIWDLDDTFWTGTLSEGPISEIKANVSLIRTLTDRGIVNSICSKNDEAPVIEQLKNLGVLDFFVFKSVNWLPKGQRIATLIKDMGLRPQNCLFLDDNVVNLNEAKFYSPDLLTSGPGILSEMISYFESLPPSDLKHKRLGNYKVLEQKQRAKAEATDNLSFLYSTNTHVSIYHDCLSEIDRITELVNRTNQLNFTKVRSTREELITLLNTPGVNAGYVKVRDNFGDYGIVGFYAIKGDTCLHFLFSCRTIGQGVEQYVYAKLNYPKLEISGEVVNRVTNEETPGWINQDLSVENSTLVSESEKKVIFVGGCDLKSMSAYLNTGQVIEEFTYISKEKTNYIEHFYHTKNLLSFPFLSANEQATYIKNYPFNDEGVFKTHIYDSDVAIIFIGTMIEPNLGVYQNIGTKRIFAFGEYGHPLTSPQEWEAYINGTIFTADNRFSLEWLKWFSENHVFLGPLSPEEAVKDYKAIFKKINPQARLCLLLGSETPFEKEENPNYFGRAEIYKQLNQLIRQWAKEEERVLYIDFNDYIKGQQDFTNNINHFQRRVYYEAALKANQIISGLTGQKLEQKSKVFLKVMELIDDIGKTGFYQTRLWHIMRKPYVWVRSKMNS